MDEEPLTTCAPTNHAWRLIAYSEVPNPPHGQLHGITGAPYYVTGWTCHCGATKRVVRPVDGIALDDPDKLMPAAPPSSQNPSAN